MIFSVIVTYEAVDAASAFITRDVIESVLSDYPTLGPVAVSEAAEVAPMVVLDDEGEEES